MIAQAQTAQPQSTQGQTTHDLTGADKGAEPSSSEPHSPTAATAAPVNDTLRLTSPVPSDGAAVFDLVARCKPLDENSMYCNLLQCSHFADTCVAAHKGENLVGFVSGYIPPSTPDVLFVWQVAVDEAMRGQRLAQKMIEDILRRPACVHVERIHTTITPDNAASQALFRALAKRLDAPVSVTEHFTANAHFAGRHQSEFLWNIGPFQRPGA